MLGIRFNHVFFALMGLALLSAFVIPSKYTDKAIPQFQMLLAPVARPARSLAAWLAGDNGRDLAPDPRPTVAIRLENEQLVQENIWLRQHLEELQRINGEREKMGDLRSLCTPVAVLGNDPGPRESLAVAGSSLEGLHDGMYVVYPGGVVGTLQRTGVAGGQVRLITNPGFRFLAYFSGVRTVPATGPVGGAAKPESRRYRLNPEPVLVEGAGRQQMSARMRAVDVVTCDIKVGDQVVLDDPDPPAKLRGTLVGRVIEIRPHKESPLFSEIRISPTSDLLKLREVMVLSKVKG